MGERRWYPQGTYHGTARVPVHLLAVHDAGQAEPWYLASTLADADASEHLYRWRMRLECTNRDFKTGVLLREGDDHHALTQPLPGHRLLPALAAAEWLCALTGLQAAHDLPHPLAAPAPAPPTAALPDSTPAPDDGPALPPPVLPQRGATPLLPRWLRRFAVRGWLSYVRLGLECLRAPDLRRLVRRAIDWLGAYLVTITPLWRPWQRRYRRLHWWPDAA